MMGWHMQIYLIMIHDVMWHHGVTSRCHVMSQRDIMTFQKLNITTLHCDITWHCDVTLWHPVMSYAAKFHRKVNLGRSNNQNMIFHMATYLHGFTYLYGYIYNFQWQMEIFVRLHLTYLGRSFNVDLFLGQLLTPPGRLPGLLFHAGR